MTWRGTAAKGETPGVDERPTEVSTPGGEERVGAEREGHGSREVFRPGQIVAGRYRVVRFLARGGMGEVYEAEDRELQQPVALKTIRTVGAARQTMLDRFKREIALARRVTHPNVCRIFDLGQHVGEPAPGMPPPPAVTFLTMELLAGETLATRLRRERRLDTAAALPLVREMAAALDAAHRARVVHRDFKPENVFLVGGDDDGGGGDGASDSGSAGSRVVITDFGVARGQQEDRFASRVTGAGIVGTPAYMAPEQVAGDEVGPAADVYAFGIVLYEMVTGSVPFEGDNPLTTAVKRLQEPPTPPHLHVPDLDPRWEAVILRCLAREPAARFASAGEATAALAATAPTLAAASATAPDASSHLPPAVTTTPPARPRTPRRRLLLELALLAVVALAAVLFFFNRARAPEEPQVTPRRSLAVLGFANVSGREDLAWLSTALSRMLTTELESGEALRLASSETVARVRQDQDPAIGESLAPETLARLRTLLGSDFVVHGTYTPLGGDAGGPLRLDLRLEDAALGSTVTTLAVDGRQEELSGMVSQLGETLRQRLGVTAVGDADPQAGMPADPEAARLYAEALDQLAAWRPREARDLLLAASEREPRSALLHYSLSRVWLALGYTDRAAEAAERAYELSEDLPRADRLELEANYRTQRGDRAGALLAYQALFEAFPDNVEHGLRLIAAASTAGQPGKALETVEALRRLPAPAAEDPRIDLAEAEAAGLAGDPERQLEAARRGADRAATLGATSLEAQGRLMSSQASRALGRPAPAAEDAAAALALYRAGDDLSGVAAALTAEANTLLDRGQVTAATARYAEAVAEYETLGARGAAAATRNNLALVWRKRGDLDRATELYDEAEAIYRETGDTFALANTLNNRAVVEVERGRLEPARRLFEEALELWRKAGHAPLVAYALANIAGVERREGHLAASLATHREALALREDGGQRLGLAASLHAMAGVLLDLGQLAEAETVIGRALAIAEETGDRSALAQSRYRLGELRALEGRFEAAREAHEAALAARRQLEEGPAVLDGRLALADLRLAGGAPLEAEILAQGIAETAAAEGRSLEEAAAWRLVALARLAEGRVAAAAEAIATAAERSRGCGQPGVVLPIEIAAARIAAAGGREGEAAADLAEIAARAAEDGYSARAYEARGRRLGLLAASDPAARRELAELVAEVRRAGFGRLAAELAADPA